MSVRTAFLLVVLVTLAGAQRAHAADAFEREFGAGAIPGADAPGAPERGSTLAYPLVSGQGAPDLVLAQRTIERHWGLSEDSTYKTVDVPGWKSEGGAMAMSFAVPGTGQLYVGERYGYLFLLIEALGIYEVWDSRHTASDLEKQARGFVGNPADSTSRWSFDAWEKKTGQSADGLRALYAADPVLFYSEISYEDRLDPGWNDSGSGDANRAQYTAWRNDAESHLKHARMWTGGLWANHLVAAADALRAARLVNLPLQRDLELRLRSGWKKGGPQFTATLERRF